MAEAPAVETPAPQPSNGQLTSSAPPTEREKDPKRQAAGRAAAEKTRQAREAQEKELENSKAELAKYKEREAAAAASPISGQEAVSDEKSFSFGTVLALGGLLIGAASLYYQREAVQESKSSVPKSKESATVASELAPAPQRKGGIRKMD